MTRRLGLDAVSICVVGITLVIATTPQHAEAQEATVSLAEGQLVSFITSIAKPDSTELRERYDKEMAQFAVPFGLAHEASLRILVAQADDYRPDPILRITSWPSRAKAEELESHAAWSEMRLLQESIWDELRITRMTIPRDMALTFRADRIYRVVSLWLSNENPLDFQRYREALSETVAGLGGRYVIELVGEEYDSLIDESGPPDLFWIIEWPSRDAHTNYIGSQTFQENYHFFNSGVAKFHVFETRFDFSTGPS